MFFMRVQSGGAGSPHCLSISIVRRGEVIFCKQQAGEDGRGRLSFLVFQPSTIKLRRDGAPAQPELPSMIYAFILIILRNLLGQPFGLFDPDGATDLGLWVWGRRADG
jgi:hypothetical protein